MGTGARAPQKQAAPPPPHPWRVWEKFQAALQRASGGIAAKSTSQPPARPRGGLAGTPRPPASTFVLAQRRQTTSRAKASPASRGHCSPCSVEAAQGSPELLCSGRDGGGAWGDVAPRAPAASVECGLRRAPPPPSPPAGKTRASPAARPAQPLFATWARWPRGSRAASRKEGSGAAHCLIPLEASLERQECGWTVGEPRRRRPRRGVLGFGPQGGGPTGAVGDRKKGEQPLKRRAELKFHCSLLLW